MSFAAYLITPTGYFELYAQKTGGRKRLNVEPLFVFRSALVVALLVPLAGLAQEPVGEARLEEPDTLSARAKYSVSGYNVRGRLVPYPYMPAGWEFPPVETESGEGVVSLRNYLWFPNPLSSPEVIVVVREPSRFGIEMVDELEMLIEEFEFGEISAGVYVLVLSEDILPVRRCKVRLTRRGVAVDEVVSRTHRSSYCW